MMDKWVIDLCGLRPMHRYKALDILRELGCDSDINSIGLAQAEALIVHEYGKVEYSPDILKLMDALCKEKITFELLSIVDDL